MPGADRISIDLPHDAGVIRVPWREAFWTWARIAALSFGGPAGQIAVMHRILVEEKRWIGETRFLHALNYCMLLPGPEALELAIYIGWLMHRVRGGLLAGILFVLPGLVSVGLLSWAYAEFGHVGIVQGLFFGLKAAVLAVVVQGVLRVGKRALKNAASVAIAAAAFIALFVFALPFPVIVVAAALIGFAGSRVKPQWFAGGAHASAKQDAAPALIDAAFARAVRLRMCARRLRGLRGLPSSAARSYGSRRSCCCSRRWARTTSSRRSRASIPRWPSSRSAVPMPCSPTWRSRPSRPITG